MNEDVNVEKNDVVEEEEEVEEEEITTTMQSSKAMQQICTCGQGNCFFPVNKEEEKKT